MGASCIMLRNTLKFCSLLLLISLTACGGPPKQISYKYPGVSKPALLKALDTAIHQLNYTTIIFKETNGTLVIQDSDRSRPGQAVIAITTSNNATLATLEVFSMDMTGKTTADFDRFSRLFEQTNRNVGVQPERTENR